MDDTRAHRSALIALLGTYVGFAKAEEDRGLFAVKMKRPAATLREERKQAAKLDAEIAANLKELGYGG